MCPIPNRVTPNIHFNIIRVIIMGTSSNTKQAFKHRFEYDKTCQSKLGVTSFLFFF